MELTIVGCSGSVPGPDSPASSYLIQAPYEGRIFSFVLDLGPGAFGALYRYLDPGTVDAIGLSHLHPDHCLDVCAFYVGSKYSPTAATWRQIPIFGPTGSAARLAAAYEVPNVAAEEPGPGIAAHFDWRDWQPDQQIGPFDVSTVPVAHPVEAYAIRITERVPSGGSMVFSGDTGPCAALSDLARGVDVLLVESAFMAGPNNPANLHLTGREAAEAGAAAGVGSIILTHIPPWFDRTAVLSEATPHFDGPVMLAEPGAHWPIG
ncbi:MAG: MBL fold metallo-hydrolase [Propionibacteriaceae bacterium]